MFQINFSGKTVLITGAATGIGLGIAKIFTQAGANIAGCGLEESAQEFINVAQENNVKAFYETCDVTNKHDLGRFVKNTVDQLGGIDILVTNAGRNVFEGAENCTDEQWFQNIQLNLESHWQTAKLCKPYLEKKGGVIIVITSNHAYSTIPGCFPYNVTKTALTGLVKTLAIEWAPHIRTVGIAPGFIDTSGNQQWFNSFPDPAAERAKTIGSHPVKKIGTTEEIGGWCVFLSSDYAAFASGATYLIDGGRNALMQE
ncbi:SDR family oxidoreductase [Mucilaginibacter sp.]|uniref:SDR family oxidoreductase n=1 Tax=Mucilaginibacter sp. TaxID=1882438 RepID=UPI0025D7D8B5|nr:SDR family oxidoreductase [Mucilaginibacter sp.]